MSLLLLLSLSDGLSKLKSSTITLLVGDWLPRFVLWDVCSLLNLLVDVLVSVILQEVEAKPSPLDSWLLV